MSPGDSGVACSCGVAACPEMGWPHEWDPIAAGDECMAVEPFGLTAFVMGTPDPRNIVLDVPDDDGPLLGIRHKVRKPYVRYGSGYVCALCEEALR